MRGFSQAQRLCAFFLVTLPAVADAGRTVFRFSVGEELIYESRSAFKHSSGSFETNSKATYWVIEEAEAGKWKLIVATKSTFQQVMESQKEPFTNERLEIKEVTVDQFGRSTGQPETDGAILQIIFPDKDPLPEKWSYGDGEETDVRILKESEKQLTLQTESRGLFRDIYGIFSEEKLVFDQAAGRVVSSTGVQRQDYGFKGEGTTEGRLFSAKQLSPAELEALQQAAGHYFALQKEVGSAWEKLEKHPAEAENILQEVERLQKAAQKEITMEPFRGALEKSLSDLGGQRSYHVKSAEKKATVLNKPSPEWTAKDLSGKAFTLADFRGQVVLLDFWYRGCGWCIRAMPQIKELANHYQGRPVKVIGMCTDANPDDAKFVIEKMKLNYPTLLAEGINEKYGIQGFPTLVVLDQQGVVRDFHAGYSPELKDKLVDVVDKLLADPAPETGRTE